MVDWNFQLGKSYSLKLPHEVLFSVYGYYWMSKYNNNNNVDNDEQNGEVQPFE